MKPLSKRVLMKGETKPINVTDWNMTREEISIEVAQLEAALLKYGHHHGACRHYGREDDRCDCGWNQIMKALGGDDEQ